MPVFGQSDAAEVDGQEDDGVEDDGVEDDGEEEEDVEEDDCEEDDGGCEGIGGEGEAPVVGKLVSLCSGEERNEGKVVQKEKENRRRLMGELRPGWPSFSGLFGSGFGMFRAGPSWKGEPWCLAASAVGRRITEGLVPSWWQCSW